MDLKVRKNSSEKRELRRIGRLRLHHACARERFGSLNRQKLVCSGHFLKLSYVRFVSNLCTKVSFIRNILCCMVGTFLEIEFFKICITHAQENLRVSGHFWKLSSAKLAPCCCTKTIWKSKSSRFGQYYIFKFGQYRPAFL